jgi:hypothetical protein
MKITELDINLHRLQLNRDNPPDARLPVIQQYRGDSRIHAGSLRDRTLLRHGVELFAKATWFPLRQQNRSKDEKHTRIIEHLASGKAMTDEQLHYYKPLEPHDFSTPRWRFAPILVSTNRERFDITEVQAKSFAKVNGTVVLRWKKRIEKWIAPPRNHEKALDEDPLFWEYFVVGAPSVITTNINVKKKIANGTEAKCHSVAMSDTEDQAELEDKLRTSLPGSVITLPHPPYSVNMELLGAKDDWTGGSLIDDKVVIPILCGSRGNKFKTYQVRGGPQHGYRPSKAKVANLLLSFRTGICNDPLQGPGSNTIKCYSCSCTSSHSIHPDKI